MVLSLSGQALDLHSSVIFSVVLGRWASPVPLTHVFTVPVWSITACKCPVLLALRTLVVAGLMSAVVLHCLVHNSQACPSD